MPMPCDPVRARRRSTGASGTRSPLPARRYRAISSSGTPPTFDTNSSLDSGIPTVVNLTPPASIYVQNAFRRAQLGPVRVAEDTYCERHHLYRWQLQDRECELPGQPVFKYQGQGLIYGSGSFVLKNTKMCAVVAGTDCDFSTNAWDPNQNALGIVANGTLGGVQAVQNAVDVEVTSSSFQGILAGVKSIEVTTSSIVRDHSSVRTGRSLSTRAPARHSRIFTLPVRSAGNPRRPPFCSRQYRDHLRHKGRDRGQGRRRPVPERNLPSFRPANRRRPRRQTILT